jgi:hypothetical protein
MACSRLAGRRLGFSPYSRDQLRQIVAARLEGIHLFDRSAISLITSKVGRAALCVCCDVTCGQSAVLRSEHAMPWQANLTPPCQPQNICSAAVAVLVALQSRTWPKLLP